MTEHENWEREMSTEFNVMMDGIRSQPTPESSLERSLQAAEAIVMTKAANKRGRKNAALVAVMMYSVMAVVVFAISKLLKVDLFIAAVGTFAVFWAIIYTSFIVSLLVGRASSGQVLLDCGPFPAKRMTLGMSVVWFLASVGALLAYQDRIGVLIALFLFTLSSFFMILSQGRLQICENGIRHYWSWLRWNKIKSYRWEGTTDATLMLQIKAIFAFLGRGALPIAIEQKDAVDALMQQHTQQSSGNEG